MDDTRSTSLIIWDTDATSIGKSSSKLKEGLIQNTANDDAPSYPMELNNILQRKSIFKVIVKSGNIHNPDEVYSAVKILDDEELIKKYSPKESDTYTDHEYNSQVSAEEKKFKEAMHDTNMLTPLKTFGKRTRSSKKGKSVIDDEYVNFHHSSNKVPDTFHTKITCTSQSPP
ncbi:hypothetical protein T459_27574 [Capsicum annuum]|uniref:Replication factor A C-terminal domain-containing protein n=1 Tax=Capsicum annuum TaxID=4072 RepID=A0A2G2YEB7_CAPAN|nr:hypothetical protein T459_27574 [Capsicum annuum]